VPALFDIETYPTVLQMTSTITATAHNGVVAADVLARLFPCGSVTGAPKLRAMEVIAAVEAGSRGVYTGSIGAIGTDGDAVFNVAIRTLVMVPGADTARLGLGSGIVADSEAAAEWAECLQKSAFLQRRGPPDLIETMRIEAGFAPDLDRHLARMAGSARFFGWVFDGSAAKSTVLAAVPPGFSGRLRLLMAPSGAVAVQLSPLPVPPAGVVSVALAALPVPAGTFEVVFVRPDGAITEGSFTNVFVERDGVLVTPPLALGLLPGVLRARLLAEGRAVEGKVTAADLAGGFFIGNALRGLIPARLPK
jgi:para-aminobenzoate synthetase/4-amino-4-deoxychorismate lyase